MKRDLDLCRTILLAVEEYDSWKMILSELSKRVKVDGDQPDMDRLQAHVAMLEDAGLLAGGYYGHERAAESGLIRLTFQGHEFLDQSREPKRWEAVKAATRGLGFEAAKIVLSELIKRGLPLIVQGITNSTPSL